MNTTPDVRAMLTGRDLPFIEGNPYVKHPYAGDAVLLTGPRWGEENQGRIGIIQGILRRYQTEASIIFNHSTFMDDNFVSSSGGPGSIITRFSQLHSADMRILVPFWRWKNGHARADNAFHYWAYVPLWTWDGSDG